MKPPIKSYSIAYHLFLLNAIYDLKQRSVFALYSFKKLEFFEQVGKIHYFRAGSFKRAGRNFEQNSINEQVLIRASRLENDQNFLVRACSLNRHTRVGVSGG